MTTKPKLTTKLEDVVSKTMYLKELPETAENLTLVVIEESNEYWQFVKNEWVQLNPYKSLM